MVYLRKQSRTNRSLLREDGLSITYQGSREVSVKSNTMEIHQGHWTFQQVSDWPKDALHLASSCDKVLSGHWVLAWVFLLLIHFLLTGYRKTSTSKLAFHFLGKTEAYKIKCHSLHGQWWHLSKDDFCLVK